MPTNEEHSGCAGFGEYTLDRNDERVWGPAGEVRLGRKAFGVLARLVDEGGRLVTKDALFTSVWDGTVVSESALTSVIKELRRALGDDPKAPRCIESVYGRGYRLLLPVRAASALPITALAAADAGSARLSDREAAIAARPDGATLPPLLCVPAFDDALLDAAPGSERAGFADVVREEVLLALSRFQDLRLVADNAAVAADAGVAAAGARDFELRVRLVADGDAVTLYARIARLGTQELIWADRERLPPGGLAAGVDAFLNKVVAAALPRVHEDVMRRLPAHAHAHDAYAVYLQNKLAMRSADTHDAMRAVADRWEDLIARRPDFARGYAPLIYLYNTDYGYTGLGTTTPAERSRACLLARKALALAPREPHLHAVMAWCHLWAGEADLARDLLHQTLALNPFQKDRLLEVATAFMFMEELNTAAELLERCEALSPVVTEAPHEETGLLHLLQGRYADAMDCLRRVARPTVSSELYALLAAEAGNTADRAGQAARWAAEARRRWRGGERPDHAVLAEWVLRHHPFQDPGRREWVIGILMPALIEGQAAQPAQGRSPAPARRTSASGP